MANINYDQLFDTTLQNSDLSLKLRNKNKKIEFAENIIEFILDPRFLGEKKIFPRQQEIMETYYNTKDKDGYRLFQELIVISGMRSGKTRVAAWIGAYETHKLLEIIETSSLDTYFEPRGVPLGVGQRIYIVIVAAALDQAEATIFSQMRGLFEKAPWFKDYIAGLKRKKLYSADKFEMRFHNILYIKAEDSNSASQTGKTIHTLLFDEISRLDVAEGAIGRKSQKSEAKIIYESLTAGTTTFKYDRNIIVVSSPQHEDDYGMQLVLRAGKLNACEETADIIHTLAKKYTPKIHTRLGFHSSTFAYNPYIDRERDPLVLSKKAESIQAFNRDYLALPPAGIDSYFDQPEKIDLALTTYSEPVLVEESYVFDETIPMDGFGNMIKQDYVGKTPTSIHPVGLNNYFICCDPSEKKDGFAVGIGHGEIVKVENDKGEVIKKVKTIIDYVTVWQPDREKKIQVSFENVIEFLKIIASYFNIDTLTFDEWNSVAFIQTMQKIGVYTKKLPITLSMYEGLRRKVNQNLIELPSAEITPYSDLMVMELKKLQLIKNKEVNHPKGFTKDIADTIARINWLIDEGTAHSYDQSLFINEEDYLKHIGGTKSFQENVLKKVFPSIQQQSVLGSANAVFMRGLTIE